MEIPQDESIDHEAQLRDVLDNITFKNSVLDFRWRYMFQDFNSEGYDGIIDKRGPGWLVRVEFWRPDIITGAMGWGHGREEVIYRGASESAVVKTAWVLFRFIIEHEMMEGFQYKGVRIFNPHRTVGELSLPEIIASQKKDGEV
jgi:hypothetical protein